MNKVNRPKNYKIEIRHTAECALQRAIILGKQSTLNGNIVKWLDIELPVDNSGHARGRCVDLIGIDNNGNYILCELKFRKNHRDNGNPDEAAKQLRNYYELIKNNYKMFGESYHHKNGHFIDWTQVANGNTRLIIAANKAYWDCWYGTRRQSRSYNTAGIECYSIDIEENTFVKQKEKGEYTPRMPKDGFIWYNVPNK